jgi:hypothetical protein
MWGRTRDRVSVRLASQAWGRATDVITFHDAAGERVRENERRRSTTVITHVVGPKNDRRCEDIAAVCRDLWRKEMPVDTTKFTNLVKTWAEIDFAGAGPPPPPWDDPRDRAAVEQAIRSGKPSMPLVYQFGYVDPLLNNLDTVLAQFPDFLIETVAGAVYQHEPCAAVRPQLQRFLAVISNLYRSFLSNSKRAMINVPPAFSPSPPLAMFQNDGDNGPFTLPADVTRAYFGSDIGVVSLPSTYRDHPVLWASLAHEVGGHDVIHADAGLLDELADGVRVLFGGGPIPDHGDLNLDQFLGVLWSYWIDEAASDVYGLLNIGPTFALNLAGFFSALIARYVKDHHLEGIPFPLLSHASVADDDGRLDPHPTDLLRLSLAIGVIENLAGLATATRNQYIRDLQALSTLCAQGATTIEIGGAIAITRDRWLPFGQSLPLQPMQDAARRVGAYLATARLTSFGGHTIQDLETWDDPDELTAQQIAAMLKDGKSVVDQGDDAQLLAGATVAVLDQPDKTDAIDRLLEAALDKSFAVDPVWTSLSIHPSFRRQLLPPAQAPIIEFARTVEITTRRAS